MRDMKLLYFPGIKSIVEKNFDLPGSAKLAHLMQICDCDVFDYRTYNPTATTDMVQKYDVLFGSSFGGYFAFNMAVLTGQTCISVNPSLYLDKRFGMLLDKYPAELSFFTPALISALKTEPAKASYSNIHILMNRDDEVLDAQRIIDIAESYGCDTYAFEKGGHECTNFTGEMLPLIKQILKDK